MTLVSGPVHLPTPYGVKRVDVTTAAEMLASVEEALKANGADVFIGVAAVADWRIANAVSGKMKKTAAPLSFALKKTPTFSELSGRAAT